ncbi:hypothetical protein BJX76DRAFT_356721 [Aspergillus varians]
MATLNALKQALRQKATSASPQHPLSNAQYSAAFEGLFCGLGWTAYREFVIPQLSHLLDSHFNSRSDISILEIGPGPKSVIGYLPGYLRRKVVRYAAYEPNDLFATRLEEWVSYNLETGTGTAMEAPFPCLRGAPDIRQIPFPLDSDTNSCGNGADEDNDRFDVILLCHSMYGMKRKDKVIERALELLAAGGMVVVFHRDRTPHLDGLVCHRAASFPTGVVTVDDGDEEALDRLASFIAGFVPPDETVRAEWRKVCRALGRYDPHYPGCLLFGAPDAMVAFTHHATALSELAAQVPMVRGERTVKNREARLHRPAAIVRPMEVQHVQDSVRWALKHGVGLTVIGGGHSGHCLWPGVVAVDMRGFNQIDIITAGADSGVSGPDCGSLVVAGAGCTTGEIISKTMAAGLTVPLGARPSVGAGLWLQGGIGHLARLHGLACDAIVGAVAVSVESGQVLCIGRVPDQHKTVGAVHPENEADLLWAIKGAGTHVGIIVSVTFKASVAPTYTTRNWVVPLGHDLEACARLNEFDQSIASELPHSCSADAYIYSDGGEPQLGVTMFESSTPGLTTAKPIPRPEDTFLGPEDNCKIMDSVELFDADMYMSGMHGGHGGSKTSSFKRCLFLKDIGSANVASTLVAAIRTSPSPLCYLHLLHGGGAVSDVAPDATAFGCRDWDFACVVTGVWPRDQDGTKIAQATVQWVYDVARDLLPLSRGVYSADLGPDPRDAVLAARGFGSNLPRLARLKNHSDPYTVLAYACPMPTPPVKPSPKLIVLVTGENGAGKDYCAEIWVSVFKDKGFAARAVSISDATKREYAAKTGADLNALLGDRAYKEQHRPALTAFFQAQVQRRPRLPEEHFLDVVYNARDTEVLFITGMRDEAPVAVFSYLVPDSRLLDVRVLASKETRGARRGCSDCSSAPTVLDFRPSLVFQNDTAGERSAQTFADISLRLPFFHEDLHRLAIMVRPVPNFPCRGIEFRHVLNIAQSPGGLTLCTSLLQSHFAGDWASVAVVACCEAGGFVYASALASRVDKRLALIRDAGKLPPPKISVDKPTSHISSSACRVSAKKSIEMGQDLIPRGASVVVVDDVLSTGKTLCAVLQLLELAGVAIENIRVIVVAEFPIHRGRELLRQHGFGRVGIQSLLVYGGA